MAVLTCIPRNQEGKKEEKVGGREREGSQAWWSTQVISELRRWRHEDLELKVILGYVVYTSPCLKNGKK